MTTVAEPIEITEITVAEKPADPCEVWASGGTCQEEAEYVAVFSKPCGHGKRLLVCPRHKRTVENVDGSPGWRWSCTICGATAILKGIYRIK